MNTVAIFALLVSSAAHHSNETPIFNIELSTTLSLSPGEPLEIKYYVKNTGSKEVLAWFGERRDSWLKATLIAQNGKIFEILNSRPVVYAQHGDVAHYRGTSIQPDRFRSGSAYLSFASSEIPAGNYTLRIRSDLRYSEAIMSLTPTISGEVIKSFDIPLTITASNQVVQDEIRLLVKDIQRNSKFSQTANVTKLLNFGSKQLFPILATIDPDSINSSDLKQIADDLVGRKSLDSARCFATLVKIKHPAFLSPEVAELKQSPDPEISRIGEQLAQKFAFPEARP